jgi:hypothetical protein
MLNREYWGIQMREARLAGYGKGQSVALAGLDCDDMQYGSQEDTDDEQHDACFSAAVADAVEDAFAKDDEDDAQDGASEVPVQVDGASLLPSDCSDWQYVCADEVDEESYCYSASDSESSDNLSCDETSSVGSDASIISISSSMGTISSNGTGEW